MDAHLTASLSWTQAPPNSAAPVAELLERAALLALTALSTSGSSSVVDRLLDAYHPDAGRPAALLEWVPPRDAN